MSGRDGTIGGMVMYGAPPVDPWPVPEVSPALPIFTPPIFPQTYAPVVPVKPVPPLVAETVKNLQARKAWLENELRMHEAWVTELGVVEEMLGAYRKMTGPLPSSPLPGEAEKP